MWHRSTPKLILDNQCGHLWTISGRLLRGGDYQRCWFSKYGKRCQTRTWHPNKEKNHWLEGN